MREILFRGKRKDDGRWLDGSLLVDTQSSRREIYIGFVNYRLSFEVIPETIGQFTGLLDKNGKKIFEGDIVKDRYTKGIVTFDKHRIQCCGCCYNYHNTIGFYVDEGEGAAFSDEDTWNIFEVIGNIYDNPELMEKTKCSV